MREGPDWYPYEGTIVAEFYHELRNAGFKFEQLDIEKTVGARRRRLDLAYKPAMGGDVGVATKWFHTERL